MRTDLYPAIEPNQTGTLRLEEPHVMYWESSGNPAGVPVLFLHGGPGAGASPTHRRFFDPSFYRIIIFDQRGSGRSTPIGSLHNNTTQHLVEDIETLRRHLGIERWLIFGGSWGSTLGLAYGQRHPERCLGFILRGIFMCREVEVDWFITGIRTVFPEAWRDFAGFIPAEEREDLETAYYKRLIDPDPAVHLPAARAWSRYEGACSTLLPSGDSSGGMFGDDRVALGLSRLEAHYFVNRVFLEPGELLDKVELLRRHPATIIQGRYDMICPIMTADALAQAWPEARYVIVPDAGHSALEPGIRAALVTATQRFRDQFRASQT